MTATLSMSTRKRAMSGQLPLGPLDFDLSSSTRQSAGYSVTDVACTFV